MNRPDGQGYRLVFHEQVTPDLPGLMFVIGLADAELGVTGKEIQANVTIIDQVNGTFFSTQEQPRCWSTLTDQQLLRGTVEETWRINGELYCAGALAALMGPGSVTLADVRFSGIVKPETETTN